MKCGRWFFFWLSSESPGVQAGVRKRLDSSANVLAPLHLFSGILRSDWYHIHRLELTSASNQFAWSFLLLVKSTPSLSYRLDVLLRYPSCEAAIILHQRWERRQNPGHDWLRLEGLGAVYTWRWLPFVHSKSECCERGIVRWCQSSADWKEHWWSVS